MIKSLYISNYALISELNIDFDKGFSTITGETGAGKSIILGALSLILGQRAELKSVKNDAEKCVIEAVFDISDYKYLDKFFIDNDLDKENNLCIIRRELFASGKSRAFINDTPVSLIILKELSNKLIDIHSQHDNLLLSNESYQLEVVDTIAQNADLQKKYYDSFVLWQSQLNELKKLQQIASKQASDLDYLQFQFKQLSDVNLHTNEQEELEQEQETLSHSEEIKTELNNVQILFDEDQSVLPMLKDVLAALTRIKTYISTGNNWLDRIHTAYIELKDIKLEVSAFSEKVEFNPSRLEWVENRLSELYTLQKKYKVATVSELISIKDDLEKQLLRIENYDEELQALKTKITDSLDKVKINAKLLSNSRIAAIAPIEDFLKNQLIQLGIPNIQFQVQISELSDFSIHGLDEVQFLFSANKNRPVQPVQLIASGGEISRLMLSIKYLVAHKSDLPTIVFDEIDTGVSGEIAHRMGEIMHNMSKTMQVITITHLPQIAAKSKNHYRVFKDESGFHTQTYIQKLTNEERVQELAQMLSGKTLTPASLQNARDLLNSESE